MLLSKLNLKTKTLTIISLSLTLLGILFILASSYIGAIAIRIALIIALLLTVTNIKMTYKYLNKKDKLSYSLAILACLISLYKTETIMLALGTFLLYLSLPPYIKTIKSKDYSDIITLAIYGLGILFSIYCIINSKAALDTTIKIIGISLIITGCLTLYDILTIKTPSTKKQNTFEDTSTL